MKKQGKIISCMVAAGFMAMSSMTVPAYAGEWVQTESAAWKYVDQGVSSVGWQEIGDQWYYFDADGTMLTGWIQDPDRQNCWYYLNASGAWEQRPAMDDTAACHLMENALIRANLYQNEDAQLVVLVEESSGSTIKVSARTQDGPNSTSILNYYEINKRTGAAKAAIGNDFMLY